VVVSSKVVARREVQSRLNKKTRLRHSGTNGKLSSATQGYADRFNDFGDTFRGAELWEEVIDHFGMLALVLALLVGLLSPVAASAQDGIANPFEQPWKYSQAEVINAPAGWPEVPDGLWEILTAEPGVLAENLPEAAAKAKPLKIKRKYDVNLIGERGVGKGINFYSTDREITLGRGLSEEIERQTKLFEDPKVAEYVNRIVQNLVRNSDANVPFRVKIIDSDEVNAFALPGGFMYVNTGLILATENEAELAGVLAENEAELAGVLAHEIAHVAARHATRNATKQDIWNLASIPLIFVGGPAGVAVRNIAQLAVPMSFLKFSRNAEREADLLGLEYQYAAGYDPAAMVGFFEKLKTQDKKKGNFIARAFSTHPMNDDRLKRSQQTINTMLPERDQYLLTSSEFQEIKGRLQALIAGTRVSETQDPSKPVLRKAK
jgi:beta-barrel assembly-enhancing protease